MSAVKRAVTSVVNTVTGKRNIIPAVTRNRNSLLTATELKNMLKNQPVQSRAAESKAKAEIVEAPLEWINSAGAWLDKGITKAVGYNDASFRGQYDYMVAEWITEAECAAYDYCTNTLQKLLPKADVERVLKGTGLIIGGAFKEIGGMMLTAASTTVSWAGIGIPGIGAGVITASAGASDIKQGIEEFSLGWNGDSITKTTNGLCDMLYGGNESIYHLSTGISGIAGNLLTSYVIAAYSKNPITAAEALKTTEKKPTTKEEGTPAAEGEIAGSTVEGGTLPKGTLIGKLDGLTADERGMIEDLLSSGKNVEIIPRSNTSKTPDFFVDGVKTELKTLNGSSLNTPVTRIEDGFEQGAEVVIIDGRKNGLTLEQASTVIERALGKYDGELPGIVEIWTNEGILRR